MEEYFIHDGPEYADLSLRLVRFEEDSESKKKVFYEIFDVKGYFEVESLDIGFMKHVPETRVGARFQGSMFSLDNMYSLDLATEETKVWMIKKILSDEVMFFR